MNYEGKKFRVKESALSRCGTYRREHALGVYIVIVEYFEDHDFSYEIFDRMGVKLDDCCDCFSTDDLIPYGLDPKRKINFIN